MFTYLAINWSGAGLQIAQLLLSLSILIILHEFGHFITARMFKCRVEKFYLFFDPWFSVFKKKVGDTEYGIGWLPLGGYVKISGMIDESMDKEQLKQPPAPWEFRSKPAWQRLIIMLGGVLVNIILAFLIYAMILMVWGEKKTPISSMKYGIAFHDPVFKEIGFQDGDKILRVDEDPVDDFNTALKRLIVVDKTVTVERDGKEVVLDMPVRLIGKIVEERRKNKQMIGVRIPVVVKEVGDSFPAFKAGLTKGDEFVSLNGKPAKFEDQYFPITESLKKGDSVTAVVMRDGQEITLNFNAAQDGMLGFMRYGTREELDSMGIVKTEVKKYGFFAAFPAGVKKAGTELSFYVNQFKKIISPETEAYKGVGGFKSMGSVFPDTHWDWEYFWTITAFFSIALAFMNLLPIPALDGGHVMFTLYEIITGRKPNEKFLEYAQIAGMILLIGLMLYANGNDWFGWGK